jgi:predicted peptidase
MKAASVCPRIVLNTGVLVTVSVGRTLTGRGRLLAVGVVMLVLMASGAAAWRWGRKPEVRMDWISASVDGLPYRVLLPAGYDRSRSYPAILYLHQYMMGNDPDVLLHEVEGWFAAPWFREKFPAIVVVPVLDQRGNAGANFGGKRVGPVMEDAAIAAVQQAVMQYHGDPARVYVTGSSMGGMGAWDMLLHDNARDGNKGRVFAAGLVLAGRHGTADPEQAAQVLRGVPIWAIHGGQDHEVSAEWDRTMARLLGGTPAFQYTEDPGLGHDVWHTYYERPEVWGWLFGQRAGG